MNTSSKNIHDFMEILAKKYNLNTVNSNDSKKLNIPEIMEKLGITKPYIKRK